MRFYTKQHRYYCGIDLHARSMDVCIRDTRQENDTELQAKNRQRASEMGVLGSLCTFSQS